MSTQLILKAADFAARKHVNQKRKGPNDEPYINHPIEVANFLSDIAGVSDHELLMAAILHDTIEDTSATKEELEEEFGHEVTSLVLEVTDDRTLPKLERKEEQVRHAPHLSKRARLLKIADKISNVEDMLENPPIGWDLKRRRDYLLWADRVVRQILGENEALDARFLEALKAGHIGLDQCEPDGSETDGSPSTQTSPSA
ncbi:MAG: HD domain-containing protein [Pyrinomonadaceae bacterium]